MGKVWLVWFAYWILTIVAMILIINKIEQPSQLPLIETEQPIVIQGNSLLATASPFYHTPKTYAVLSEIAKCESGNSHYDDNGKVKRGKINPHDIGKYQINEIVWGEKAKELGYDIYDEKGNELMAIWIYENYGTYPWRASGWCWKK